MSRACPRRAVYSALLGKYERPLLRPVHADEGVDYIFFTDSPTADPGAGWKTIRVQARFANDSVRSARYLKIVGHPLLDDYDETLWIDNRVILKRGSAEFFSKLDGHDLALPYHSFRDTVRDEFSEVISSGYDDPERVRAMYEVAFFVLPERPLWTGIIARKVNPAVRDSMRLWFDHVLLTSRRDQLSVNFALTSTGLRTNAFELPNTGSRFHEWVGVRTIGRSKSVQFWRRPRRTFGLAVADMLRLSAAGRKVARVCGRVGVEVKTLPAVSSLRSSPRPDTVEGQWDSGRGEN